MEKLSTAPSLKGRDNTFIRTQALNQQLPAPLGVEPFPMFAHKCLVDKWTAQKSLNQVLGSTFWLEMGD